MLTEGWADALLLAVIICASRAALVLACRTGVPAARTEGLGAAVAGSVAPAAAVAVLADHVRRADRGGSLVGWPLVGARRSAAVLAAAAVMILVLALSGRFGGVTGDVMGAGVEVALTIMLLGGAGSE